MCPQQIDTGLTEIGGQSLGEIYFAFKTWRNVERIGDRRNAFKKHQMGNKSQRVENDEKIETIAKY